MKVPWGVEFFSLFTALSSACTFHIVSAQKYLMLSKYVITNDYLGKDVSIRKMLTLIIVFPSVL